MRAPLRLYTCLAMLCINGASGRMLDPSDWIVRDENRNELPHLIDNRLTTAWVTLTEQVEGMYIDVDLGRSYQIHRVYMTPYTLLANYPRGLTIYAGTSLTKMHKVGTYDCAAHIETDLRFLPRRARYLRFAIDGDGAGYAWAIAEMLVFGVDPDEASTHTMAVVKTPNADPLTAQAEKDLHYYLMERTGQVVRLLTPTQAATFAGQRFRIAPIRYPDNYKDYMKSDLFASPEHGGVHRNGQDVIFSGHTARASMYAVYEFLHQLGVRWLHPSALGDYVPPAGPLDLSFLPMTNAPSFTLRYANWNTERYEGSGEPYLWYFRNRWNKSWGGRINDRPGKPQPPAVPNMGYTHTFTSLVDGKLFEKHPDWFPLLKSSQWTKRIGSKKLGKRLPYSATWGLNFCTSTPDIVPHIVNRILAKTDPPDQVATTWITPMDAGVWCECRDCQNQDDPKTENTGDWRGPRSHTARYMRLVTDVANALREPAPNLHIGTFAYEDYIDPPRSYPTLPDNVDVDVIQYGFYNLPLTSISNRWMRSIMTGWSQRWDTPGHVGVYDWALLTHEGEGMPIPLVRATSDRARFWHRIGVQRLGTQADATPVLWRRNPCNYYAYSRLAWDVNEPVNTLLEDFFNGYYREAATSMRAYYETLENHLIANNIALGDNLHYAPTDEAFPVALNRRLAAHLDDARQASRHWLTRERIRHATTGFISALLRLESPTSRTIADTLRID
jgi:hypothetical protein